MICPAIIRIRQERCALCDGPLEPAQIDVLEFGRADPISVDGPPWCYECDIGFTLETWMGTSNPRLTMSRTLTADELVAFHRPLQETA